MLGKRPKYSLLMHCSRVHLWKRTMMNNCFKNIKFYFVELQNYNIFKLN